MKHTHILQISKNSILSNVILLAVLYTFTVTFSSCSKEGCTHSCASNFDPKAKKDDGSCKGCKNLKASNYCSEANYSDDSCTCGGYGFFSAQNTSVTTVQKVLINNTNYGTLDPGEKEEFRLPAGNYEVVFQAISGGGGCNPAQIVIVECTTVARNCSY
jgi:hypothetical protein